MRQAVLLEVHQPERGLADEVARQGHGEGPSLLDDPAQIHAIHIFHDEKLTASLQPRLERVDDVRVREPAHRLDLAAVPPDRLAVPGELFADDLEGDDALEPAMTGL